MFGLILIGGRVFGSLISSCDLLGLFGMCCLAFGVFGVPWGFLGIGIRLGKRDLGVF
jgi:hypothetical protein